MTGMAAGHWEACTKAVECCAEWHDWKGDTLEVLAIGATWGELLALGRCALELGDVGIDLAVDRTTVEGVLRQQAPMLFSSTATTPGSTSHGANTPTSAAGGHGSSASAIARAATVTDISAAYRFAAVMEHNVPKVKTPFVYVGQAYTDQAYPVLLSAVKNGAKVVVLNVPTPVVMNSLGVGSGKKPKEVGRALKRRLERDCGWSPAVQPQQAGDGKENASTASPPLQQQPQQQQKADDTSNTSGDAPPHIYYWLNHQTSQQRRMQTLKDMCHAWQACMGNWEDAFRRFMFISKARDDDESASGVYTPSLASVASPTPVASLGTTNPANEDADMKGSGEAELNAPSEMNGAQMQ